MFNERIEAIIDDVKFRREKRESGEVTAKITFEGALTDQIRADLGDHIDGLMPGDGEAPPFRSATLDLEYEHQRLQLFPANGQKLKLEGIDVKVKAIKLVKGDEGGPPVNLRFTTHTGPLKRQDWAWLVEELGHLVGVDLSKQQGELELGD